MDRHDPEILLSIEAPDFDADAALRRLRHRVTAERISSRPDPVRGLLAAASFGGARGWLRPVGAVAGTLLLATTLAVTGVADTILTIFEPTQVATINVDPSQLNGVPDPTRYGTLTWIAQPQWVPAADIDAAAAAVGFRPLAPASLPAGVAGAPRFTTMGEAKATFQFDEAKARAAATEVGATLPPMPAAIANTTLTMSGGPAVMQQYGEGGVPRLAIVQAKAPVVVSNGATVEELREYMLAQPGIPPAVAAQIRAIGDPVRTLLIPVGLDVGEPKLVSVRGTRGYFVGDDTGLGSGIVWLENGYAHAVLAPLGEGDLIALVNGLR